MLLINLLLNHIRDCFCSFPRERERKREKDEREEKNKKWGRKNEINSQLLNLNLDIHFNFSLFYAKVLKIKFLMK